MQSTWPDRAFDNINSILFAAGCLCAAYGTLQAGWGWFGMFLIGASFFFFILGHSEEIRGDFRRTREEASRWTRPGEGGSATSW